jgi:ATP-dependent DNA helicase RecG
VSDGGRDAGGEGARAFRRLARAARDWLRAPSEGALADLVTAARDATPRVPEDRRQDWDRLLAGFAAPASPESVRPRVEGLARASALFERQARERARLETPLSWQDAVDRVAGLGPTARERLAERGVVSVADLVWTLPVAWDDLRAPLGVAETIEAARAPEVAGGPPRRVCVRALVKSASFVAMRGRRSVRVVAADEAGKVSLDAWWFYAAHGIVDVARPGTTCLFVGRITLREGKRPMMAHPDVLRDDAGARGVRPRYPALGVPAGTLRKAVAQALARTAPLPDPVPRAIAAREQMPDAEDLLRLVHGASPDRPPAEARGPLAERLAWVEGFTRVWQRLLAEAEWKGALAPALARDDGARGRLLAALAFELTGAQRKAIDVIAGDLARTIPMRRLLMGDVGTGKTVVALAAAAQCVAAGFQCALLGPTGVLAEQYVDAAQPLVRGLGARLASVASGMRAASRRSALEAIASGEAQLVVGTHALLGEDVVFRRLGLVVVDEQQRLGVAQRLQLVRKGEGTRPHLLSLSATPIPRTLALAMRGELATSVLDERPRGRAPVTTELRARGDLGAMVEDIRGACASGGRVFVVCPRIEDDDEEDEGAGVLARAEQLGRDLPAARVVVVHGAMPAGERGRAMRAFRAGEAQVLVGTSVIEVGIDVPEATLMIVDGAERFGLAQLHQLRGRVGRGRLPARCVLLHEEPLGDLARRRLETLAATTDGAEIARVDLTLRGAGDLGGTRQSGIAEDFAWLDPSDPPRWVERIEQDARAILASDPALRSPEHEALAMAVRRFAVQLAVREEAG